MDGTTGAWSARLETIRLALTAAETGHLVFGTLHTTSAAKTIDRIIDAGGQGGGICWAEPVATPGEFDAALVANRFW